MEQLALWFCVNVLFCLDECGEGLQSEALNFAVDDVIGKHHPCSSFKYNSIQMSHSPSHVDNEDSCQSDGYSITFDDDINEDSLGSDRNSQILDRSTERETDILFQCDDKYEEGTAYDRVDTGTGSFSCDEPSLAGDEDLLFPGCPLTKRSSSVLIMLFILQHKLSAQACKDLIQLTSAHFPLSYHAMTSLYCLKSYLNKACARMKPMKAFVCPNCEDLIANSAEQCNREQCQEATAKPDEFLFFLDVKNAISRLFKGLNSLAVFNFHVCFNFCFCRQ